MTSFLNKQWAEAPSVSDMQDLINLLIKSRGLESEKHEKSFLNPSLADQHNPYRMHSMEVAVNRILEAIVKKERIMIFGDFDADGITSTVILAGGLREMGALTSYRIPNRAEDSHGLKDYLIDEIATKNVQLLITCDCGINDKHEVSHASKLGIDVIVTDHHEPDPEYFPDEALAILNPKLEHCNYPEDQLSGAGIAYKLISALAEKRIPNLKQGDKFLHKYLEVCAFGLIADCVPMTGENRILTKFGLNAMKNSQWPGIKGLLKNTNTAEAGIDEETIGFVLAPRINAASRMGDVLQASQLFLGNQNLNDKRIAELERLNDMRRDFTDLAFAECLSRVEEDAPCQFFVDESWNPGILGLIAGKFADQLKVPVIAARINEDGTMSGSCRAPQGYSVISALRECDDIFEKYGGHDGAAGFSTKYIYLSRLKETLKKYFRDTQVEQIDTSIVAFIDSYALNFDLLDFTKQLGPYGIDNPMPIFGIEEAEINDFFQMGKTKSHLRLELKIGKDQQQFVGFFLGHLYEELKIGKKVDVLFTIGENYWGDERKLQCRLVDVRESN